MAPAAQHTHTHPVAMQGTGPAGRVLAGTADQVPRARAFAREVLGPVQVLDEALLLLTGLCTNALTHTASGGGSFEVTIRPGPPVLRIEVRDGGAEQAPVPRPYGRAAEAGRGLILVDALAKHWGFRGGQHGRVVFFELPCDGEAASSPGPRSA